MENETKINIKGKLTVALSFDPPNPLDILIHKDLFVRFYTEEEHADSFIRSGRIKLNSLAKLRSLESTRRDQEEGIAQDVYLDLSKFKGHTKKYIMGLIPTPDIMPVDIQPDIDKVKVFCMSYLQQKNANDVSLDNIKKSLNNQYQIGESRYAVIFGVQTFLNSFNTFLKEHDLKNKSYLGLVKYQITTPFDFLGFQDGDLFMRQVCFVKDICFEKEHEFRCAFIDDNDESPDSFFDLGSMQYSAIKIELHA